MAEKTIGIRIQLNGINGVVKDIQTLEKFIQEAKADLKQLEIGSDLFSQLTTEISTAEGQLRRLNQQTEALTNEKKAEGIGKLGAGISSSFAAATAAVSLFGDKNEEVSKAAAQAQNLLTIALSTRGIMEVKTGAQIVAKTIAEKASAAATVATTTATRTLYATLAANPYGAIVAAIGLLVAAFVAFGAEEEKQIEKTKTLNDIRIESLQSIADEQLQIQILTQILNDSNASLDAKKGAYAELQKLVPTLTNLTYEQAQAEGVLNAYIETQLSLLKLRAEARAIEEFLVEQKKLEIKNAEQLAAAQERQRKEEERLKEAKMAYNGATKEELEVYKRFKDYKLAVGPKELTLEEKLLKLRTEIAEIESKNTTIIDKQKKSVDNSNKTEQQRNKEREAYIQLLIQEIKLTSDLLVQSQKLADFDNELVKSTEEKIQAAEGYAKELEKLKAFSELYKKATGDLLPVQDKLGEVFTDVTLLAEKYINSLDVAVYTLESAKESTKDFDEGIKRLGEGLNPEQLQLLQDFANNYKEIFSTIQMLQQFKGKALGFTVEDFQKVVTDLNLSLGKITRDPYERSAEEITAAKVTAQERYNVVKQSFVDEYTLYLQAQEKKKGLTDAEIKNNEKTTREIAAATFESLAGVGNELLKFEQGVFKTAEKIVELNKKLQELAPAARAGFIVSNAEEIAKQYGTTIPIVLRNEKALSDLQAEIAKKTFDEKKEFSNAIFLLEADLAQQGIDIDTLTYEQKLVLLEKFLAKEVEKTKTAEQEKEDARKKTIDSISEGLDQFNNLVGRLASVTSQYYAFQLKQLEDSSRKLQEQVVGDTEEANKKRLELESQYQKQKAEIEKRAQVRSLQLQLAQAIADGAQAVLSVIEVPPLAIAVGLLAAAQVALIAQQLAYVQSLAGGGRVRMSAGGMVMGPAHEYGGVSFANGVNLEGGESVINRQSSLNYGGLLSTINQSGGGAPLINNASNSLMEERLLQAIAKTKNEPIRAYVLSSEITNSQAINRKLDELSTI